MYKLKDLQGAGMREGVIYNTKEEIIKDLCSFHNQDFTGTDREKKAISIEEFFKVWYFETINDQLEYLLDYGCWELVEIKGD